MRQTIIEHLAIPPPSIPILLSPSLPESLLPNQSRDRVQPIALQSRTLVSAQSICNLHNVTLINTDEISSEARLPAADYLYTVSLLSLLQSRRAAVWIRKIKEISRLCRPLIVRQPISVRGCFAPGAWGWWGGRWLPSNSNTATAAAAATAAWGCGSASRDGLLLRLRLASKRRLQASNQ